MDWPTDKKYQIVYADPPWWTDGKKVLSGEHKAFDHYGQMTFDELAQLPVSDITTENAALFLWTTDTALPQAIRLVEAWGFKYKTVAFNWVKTGMTGKVQRSLRQWTFGNAELCLLGIKGSMIQQRTPGINQLIMHPRLEHSKKPDGVRRLIMHMFPACADRIELFARCLIPGWDAWGNEV